MKGFNFFLAILFGVLVILDCYLINSDLQEYRLYTKTLLVPVLLIIIYNASKDTKHKRSKVLATLAFLFCFLGDLFLLNEQDPYYFIFGLSSFLIAHIFFIIFFYRLKPFKDKYRLYLFSTGVPILSYIMFLLFLIWSNVSRQNLEIPVTAYAIVLGFMLLTATHTFNNKSTKRLSKKYFIPGAIFFVISDSILAINKFSIAIAYAGILVITTYAIAIFLLSIGVAKFLKK